MTSAWVLIIASVLHFGVRRSCFLNIEQLPMLPDTLFARHIAYCAILHFLYDQELLPARYRRRMGLLIGFIVELVLGVAFMELLGQWLWFRVEHMVHRCLLLSLRLYGGLSPEVCQYLEKAVMRGFMTSLAGLLWLNAYAATEPVEPQASQVATDHNVGLARQKNPRHLAKKNEQAARRSTTTTSTNNKGQQEQATPEDQKQKLRQKLKQKMKLRLKQKAEQTRKQLLEQGKDKRQEKEDQEQEKEQKKQEEQQEQKQEQKQAKNPELLPPVAEEEEEEEASSLEEQPEHLTTASDC